MKTIRLGWGIALVVIAVYPALAQTPAKGGNPCRCHYFRGNDV